MPPPTRAASQRTPESNLQLHWIFAQLLKALAARRPTLIVLDDLLATGGTMAAAIHLLRSVGGDVRAAASDKRFLLAVLDFLMADEPLLLAFAASETLTPETVVAAYRKLHKAVDPAYEAY